MANSVIVKQPCTLEDIQYLEDVTLMFSVDEEGYPRNQVDHTEEGDFREYHCTNCHQDFDDFESVKEHLHV